MHNTLSTPLKQSLKQSDMMKSARQLNRMNDSIDSAVMKLSNDKRSIQSISVDDGNAITPVERNTDGVVA